MGRSIKLWTENELLSMNHWIVGSWKIEFFPEQYNGNPYLRPRWYRRKSEEMCRAFLTEKSNIRNSVTTLPNSIRVCPVDHLTLSCRVEISPFCRCACQYETIVLFTFSFSVFGGKEYQKWQFVNVLNCRIIVHMLQLHQTTNTELPKEKTSLKIPKFSFAVQLHRHQWYWVQHQEYESIFVNF